MPFENSYQIAQYEAQASPKYNFLGINNHFDGNKKVVYLHEKSQKNLPFS